MRTFRVQLREWGPLALVGPAAVVFAMGAVAAYWFLPGVLVAGLHFSSDAKRASALNDARGSVIQMLGGLLVLAGAYLTARTLRLNRAGHISDRFSKAVDQLGHGELQTRVGGVYSLERVMRDAPFEQRAVVETLVALLREERAITAVGSPGHAEAPAGPPADVAAALRVIGRRKVSYDPAGAENFGWNLTELNLRDFSLRAGNYEGVNFWRSDLRRANLCGADLRGIKGWREADFAEAVYDHGTLLPAGLDPAAVGMLPAEAQPGVQTAPTPAH